MKKKVIRGVVIWILLYFLFFRLLPYLDHRYSGCKVHKEIYNQSFRCLVIRKFLDSANHLDETILYLGDYGMKRKFVFIPGLEEIYDYINAGDSLIKEKNSIYYKVKSKTTGKDTIFEFVSMCKDSIKTR